MSEAVAGTDTKVVYDDELPPGEHHHPGVRTYVMVGLVLAVVTAIEVWVYYIDQVRPYLLWLLLTLGTIKFVLVAGYFMHLKFDAVIFRRLFVGGIVLAMIIYMIVLLTFGVFIGTNTA